MKNIKISIKTIIKSNMACVFNNLFHQFSSFQQKIKRYVRLK
jgi:hypothetical protein